MSICGYHRRLPAPFATLTIHNMLDIDHSWFSEAKTAYLAATVIGFSVDSFRLKPPRLLNETPGNSQTSVTIGAFWILARMHDQHQQVTLSSHCTESLSRSSPMKRMIRGDKLFPGIPDWRIMEGLAARVQRHPAFRPRVTWPKGLSSL